MADGVVQEVRETSSAPDGSWRLSPAFVNAHSHLEYRAMAGRIELGDMAAFLRSIAAEKREESLEAAADACRMAAHENLAAGVGLIAEHSDRPGAVAALREAGIGGRVWKEVITIASMPDPSAKLAELAADAAAQGITLTPHAPYTVDAETLASLAKSDGWLSIHAAESQMEEDALRHGKGAFVEMCDLRGFPRPPAGLGPIELLLETGFLGAERQLVHCCLVSDSDIEAIAKAGSSAAHCPRSNLALACPAAPVRRMREAGIKVGIGLDSPASSGPISMLAEMQAAAETAAGKGEPLEWDDIWLMATTEGAASIGLSGWEISPGSRTPLIGIEGEEVRWIVPPG